MVDAKEVIMKITYKDYESDIDAINNSKVSPIERYSIDIDGEQKKPSAMSVLDILDRETTFEDRAEFVKTLLLGCKVTVYEDNKKLFELGVTPGMQWWAVKEFEEKPFALKYIINAVYARFLKNYTV